MLRSWRALQQWLRGEASYHGDQWTAVLDIHTISWQLPALQSQLHLLTECTCPCMDRLCHQSAIGEMGKSMPRERGSAEKLRIGAGGLPWSCMHIHAALLWCVNYKTKTVVKINFAQEIKLIARAIYWLAQECVVRAWLTLLGGQGRRLTHRDKCSACLNLLTDAGCRIRSMISFYSVLKSCSGTVGQRRI